MAGFPFLIFFIVNVSQSDLRGAYREQQSGLRCKNAVHSLHREEIFNDNLQTFKDRHAVSYESMIVYRLYMLLLNPSVWFLICG